MSLRTDSTCYQHPGRIAGAVCRLCHRPICPECMRDASTGSSNAGWRCEECQPRVRRRTATTWRLGRTPALGTSRVTPTVAALIAVNVVIFLGTYHDRASVDLRFEMWPAAIAGGQWYRLLTSAFLHVDISHIFFNMATLAIVGPAVETALGKVRFTLVYLLAALGGSVASYLLSPFNTASVGASGAIFGVMGAYYVLARRSGTDTRTVLALIVINLVLGFADSGIDWRDHLGGLATGLVVAYGFSRVAELRIRAARVGEVLTVLVTAAVIAGAAQLPAGHVNF